MSRYATIEERAFAILPTIRLPRFSTRRIGGLRFVKLGRLTMSFSISRRYKAL